MKLREILNVALLLSLVPVGGYAQEPDSVLMARYRTAESLLRAGQYEQALPLLETLYQAHPQVYVFYDRLKQAYENLKRYDDALALIETQRKTDPRNPALLAEKGRLLDLKGDETAARRAWETALQVAPQQSSTYRIVYQTLVGLRRFDEAIEVLKRAQRSLNAPTLFQLELAYLYGLTGRYTEAFEAYRTFLQEDPRRMGFVQNRLDPLLETPAVRQAGITVFERAVRQDPLNPTFRQLLAWLYLRNGDYTQALDAYRALDRLEQAQGQLLLQFALQARDAGADDIARQALQAVLEQSATPVAWEARFELALLHEAQALQGDTVAGQAAWRHYQLLLSTYPTHPRTPEVLYHLARLALDVRHDPSAADSLLARLLDRYPEHEVAWQARFEQGRLALQRGNLGAARLAFLRLLKARRTGPLAEAARYHLALLDFYDGAFEAALAQLDILIEDAASDITNDALALRILIQENRGPDSLSTPLRRYAQAMLLASQHRLKTALDTLEQVKRDLGSHALADDLFLLEARLFRQQGRLTEALNVLLEFPLRYPQSPLVDQALFEAARLQETLGEREAAIRTYLRLLAEHPGSPLVPEARRRLRQLRGEEA
jgi:tetratricopeptide (TPR) repeat protein